MFDVVVIGAGVVGGLVARELSRYELSVAIVEKCSDVALGATRANSAIVHAGYDAKEGSLKAKLNVLGSKMMETVAEELGVKIGIENCPMLFGPDQWPGGQNLATTPKIWRKMFEIIPSDNLGINYDPSHFVWQMIDYIKPIYEFKDKIFHVHFKDIKLYRDRLNDVGVMAYPLEFMSPKLPGLGDVDWAKYVSALTDIGYDSYVCVEVEDKAFEGSKEKILDSLRLSYRYMRNFVI